MKNSLGKFTKKGIFVLDCYVTLQAPHYLPPTLHHQHQELKQFWGGDQINLSVIKSQSRQTSKKYACDRELAKRRGCGASGKARG